MEARHNGHLLRLRRLGSLRRLTFFSGQIKSDAGAMLITFKAKWEGMKNLIFLTVIRFSVSTLRPLWAIWLIFFCGRQNNDGQNPLTFLHIFPFPLCSYSKHLLLYMEIESAKTFSVIMRLTRWHLIRAFWSKDKEPKEHARSQNAFRFPRSPQCPQWTFPPW